MAHIVCVTGGLTGMLNASLALVQQLAQAGHRITYASPADLSAPVSSQGIAYVQLDPWVFQPQEPPLSRWQKLRTLRSRQKWAVDMLGVQNFVPVMQDLAPDLLLIDIEMHPHIMAAVMHQLPVALLCPFLSIWRRPNLPPIHTNIVPEEGWRGQRLGIAWNWLRYGWRKWKESQRDRWRRVGLDHISVMYCYARQLGYPARASFGFNQWLVPYPHRHLPILCLHPLELDLPHEPHPSMRYLGPMVLENRQESRVKSITNKTLEQIFDNCRSAGRSLIYCGCSSLAKADGQFLRRVMEAVAGCPQWDLVLGLGGRLDPEQLGDLPPNVYAFRWAPQLTVLQQANCAIINSGSHSITECIHYGVPMLVYSLNRADQNGNAARVRYHRLGIAGDLRQDDAVQMRRHIQALLTNPTYQAGVTQMRDRFRRYTDEDRTIQVVESLLGTQRDRRGDRQLEGVM
ncbi:MAG: nucleotide disphospho-sugar-binding domain-containing protein [Cyanobacteria bacterium P01_A01_bin.123]